MTLPHNPMVKRARPSLKMETGRLHNEDEEEDRICPNYFDRLDIFSTQIYCYERLAHSDIFINYVTGTAQRGVGLFRETGLILLYQHGTGCSNGWYREVQGQVQRGHPLSNRIMLVVLLWNLSKWNLAVADQASVSMGCCLKVVLIRHR